MHIIISAVIEEGLCKYPNEITKTIIEMVKKGYLLSFSHSGKSGDPYLKIEKIDESELINNVDKRKQFKDYPEGIEYFIQTSDKGKDLIEEE